MRESPDETEMLLTMSSVTRSRGRIFSSALNARAAAKARGGEVRFNARSPKKEVKSSRDSYRRSTRE